MSNVNSGLNETHVNVKCPHCITRTITLVSPSPDYLLCCFGLASSGQISSILLVRLS